MKNLKFKITQKYFKKSICLQVGMTYVEMIVVLSIFAIMTSIVLFNYGSFQSKVDIKNLASDMALRIVEAQKSSNSGLLPDPLRQALIVNPSTWKPAYGFYVSSSSNKSFIYFTDLNENGALDDVVCRGDGECLDKVLITKGNYVSSLNVYYQGDTNPHSLNDLTVFFKRPNTNAIISSSTSFTGTVSYVEMNVLSPQGQKAIIKVYPSGRIEVK